MSRRELNVQVRSPNKILFDGMAQRLWLWLCLSIVFEAQGENICHKIDFHAQRSQSTRSLQVKIFAPICAFARYGSAKAPREIGTSSKSVALASHNFRQSGLLPGQIGICKQRDLSQSTKGEC